MNGLPQIATGAEKEEIEHIWKTQLTANLNFSGQWLPHRTQLKFPACSMYLACRSM